MNKQLRVFLFIAIVIGWGAFYTKVMMDGNFRTDFYLPCELCNFMQMIILYVVMTNKVEVLDTMMYPAILGPIAALLHPFGIASFGTFYLVYFLFYHCTLIGVGVYRLIQRKGNVNTKDLTHSIVFLAVSAIIASFVNLVTDGNYMFVSKSIFTPPFSINYQFFLIVFTLICVTSFHFAIVFGRSLINNNKIKYRKRRTTSL